MLQRSRQIQVHSAGLTEFPYPWNWSSQNPAGQPGYLLWMVLRGEITFQTNLNTWTLPANHLFCFPNDRDRFIAFNSEPTLAGCIHYGDLSGAPRMAPRAVKVDDSEFVHSLMERATAYSLKNQLWEATANLAVILDEMVAGEVVYPIEHVPLTPLHVASAHNLRETKILQERTLNTLKKIDWSSTRKLDVPPAR